MSTPNTPSDESAEATASPPQRQPPPPPPPGADAAFAAVPRAPRVPWINPNRRRHVIGMAIVAALVLLGAGFGIGFAVAPSDDGGRGHMYRDGFGPGFHGRYLPDLPGRMGRGNGHGPFPMGPPATGGPATPSGTSTS